MNKANYAETDHMPREVATALLTTPGTRLTPAMRRSCKRAREQSLASHCPIVRGDKDGEYLYDTTKKANTPNENYLAGIRKMNAVAISKRLRRAIAKRRSVEYAFQDSFDEAKRAEMVQLAIRWDNQIKAISTEIASRNKRDTVANHKAKKQYVRNV